MMSDALNMQNSRLGAGFRAACLCGAIALGALVGGVGGCSRSNSLAIVENAAYPAELTQREVLNIHIIKHPTEIEFTNTSDRTLGPGTLWLNGRYAKSVDAIPSGATVRYTLIEFKDQWNDNFRRGGFWAKENPEVLYLTQLETGEGDARALTGFITVRAEE
jgi:hypothetical protein